MNRERIDNILAMRTPVMQQEYAMSRAESALYEAQVFLRDKGARPEFRYRRALEEIECAEAWVDYLRDLS